jgi:hypothetical protein
MERRIYRYHWLAFWKPLSVTSLLFLLGTAGLLVWQPLAFLFYVPAVVLGMALVLTWRWRSLRFTPDHRLSRRRGILGSTEDVISLFGVITPYQTPVLGRMLDVGSVHLGIPGPDIHIRHIANFQAFYHDLLFGAAQQEEAAAQPAVVQVHVYVPPVWHALDDWLNRLPQG